MSREFPGGFPPAHNLDGSWSGRVTEVPLELLQRMQLPPVPVTIGGTSQRTFTLNASVTNPVSFWNADRMVSTTNTVAYSWVVGENPVLSSAGAETTLTNGTVGVWYMYYYHTAAGVPTLIPSATAPTWVQHKYMSFRGHPGTSAARFYRYVGVMLCDATTPTFIASTKIGYTYHVAVQSVATTATFAALDFTAVVPAIEGIKVAGYLEAGAAGTVSVTGSSVAGQGYIQNDSVDLAAGDFVSTPFGPIETDGSGQLYGIDTIARGDCHITQIVDVV
jgi:hypothetical protein